MMAHMTQTPGIGTSPEPAPRKRRFRRALITVGVLIVLAAGTVIYFQVTKTPAPNVSSPTNSTPPAPTTTASSAPAPTSTFVQTAQADGCLGGPDPHTAVLAAQQAAALDSIGAAEFALAVTRWNLTYPFTSDANAVLDQIMVNPAPAQASLADSNENQQGTGNVFRVVAPESWTYRVLNNSAEAAVVQVAVTRQLVPPSTQPISQPIVSEYHLVASSGHWMVADNSAKPVDFGDPTFTTGFSPYFGGCQ